jgi:hypothetical protein
MHVRGMHRACADRVLDAFARQLIAQLIYRVNLDEHVVVEIRNLIALVVRVAVDALVLTAAVQVNIVAQPKPGVWLFDRTE